ncbi:hypothetical protein EAS56_17695 [Bradyrhizobium guangzhouense]|uniref:Uncharacterized protein n=1 Tax=Bradyrhizobium guangzhouense TaxID=1325095 RepID=A0ABY0E7Z2_9BRAD|nr:hypothetical protein [Bradyrhizobium guangzhouense]RXH12342.1 hypothetical protein EAS56_17695 [Bradyrhizobium guangzhouense]
MTTNDTSRLVATSSDSEFTLTIEDALALYAEAAVPRTPRSIQRYCAKQHLLSRRVETEFGEKYLITKASVEKHIAYIKEVTPATSRDWTRPVATNVAAENKDDMLRQEPPTTTDQSRLDATSSDNDPRYLTALEQQNAFLLKQVEIKDRQLEVKDQQITDLIERSRENNLLTAGLHKLLTPLLRSETREGEDTPRP